MAEESHVDSTNLPIKRGDRVRFRGQVYTIDRFLDYKVPPHEATVIKFLEPLRVRTEEEPSEATVDLVRIGL